MAIINKTVKTKAERKNRQYVLRQYILKEALVGAEISLADMNDLEDIINTQCERGYKISQITSATVATKGLGGGDRTLFLMLFERVDDDSESDSD